MHTLVLFIHACLWDTTVLWSVKTGLHISSLLTTREVAINQITGVLGGLQLKIRTLIRSGTILQYKDYVVMFQRIKSQLTKGGVIPLCFPRPVTSLFIAYHHWAGIKSDVLSFSPLIFLRYDSSLWFSEPEDSRILSSSKILCWKYCSYINFYHY